MNSAKYEYIPTVTGKIRRRRKPMRYEWLLYFLLFFAIVFGAYMLYGRQWTFEIDKTVEITYASVNNPAARGSYLLRVTGRVEQSYMHDPTYPYRDTAVSAAGNSASNPLLGDEPFRAAAEIYFKRFYAVRTRNTEKLTLFAAGEYGSYDVTMRVVEDNTHTTHR
jgi:hypothetical protein